VTFIIIWWTCRWSTVHHCNDARSRDCIIPSKPNWLHVSMWYVTTTTTTTTILWPLYRSTCISQHLQLRTGGFCWCNVLLLACPCWLQPAHSEDVEFSSAVVATLSLYHNIKGDSVDDAVEDFLRKAPASSPYFWHCWLSVRKSIRPVKIEQWGVGVVICLEQGADCLHVVQLMPLRPHNPIISSLI